MKKINWLGLLRELATVVFGILIAFGLNNWAQSNKEDKQAQEYLKSLRNDLVQDSINLEKTLTIIKEKQQLATQTIIPHFFQNMPGRDSIPLNVFKDLASVNIFIPHKGTYQSLVYGGGMNLIPDFELKKEITEYYARFDELDFENHRSMTYSQDILIPYFFEEVSFRDMGQQTDELLSDYRLQNMVFGWTGIYRLQIESFQNALTRCKELLAKLPT